MPSSLIFAALAMAWLVVLVPMVARRRTEAARPIEPPSTSRVVRRGDRRGSAQEGVAMSIETSDEARADYRYRPGRGGFDPQAAAAAARAKYAFRQRAVLFLFITAVGSALIGGFVESLAWYACVGLAVILVGYMSYLRRQVRIEEDVRRRRMARLRGQRNHPAGSRPRRQEPVEEYYDEDEADEEVDEYEDEYDEEPEPEPAPRIERRIMASRPKNTEMLDVDEGNPDFEELGEPNLGGYRRAVGE
ncbi:hypothetical protein D5S17_26695 [Pseudonocardiaceae bacterium YIM PH 21723]|nr:hypothetical protein D5S17_26695 [Pseudonocardiaceae bacterium YIM PH 21723]